MSTPKSHKANAKKLLSSWDMMRLRGVYSQLTNLKANGASIPEAVILALKAAINEQVLTRHPEFNDLMFKAGHTHVVITNTVWIKNKDYLIESVRCKTHKEAKEFAEELANCVGGWVVLAVGKNNVE